LDTERQRLLRRYAACVGVLIASLVVFPLLALGAYVLAAPSAMTFALPRILSNVLFFWPQYLLLPNGVVAAGTDSSHLASLARYPCAAFWLGAVAAYVWITRRARARWVLLGLLPAVAAVAQLLLLALRALGFAPVLDGP
jgi:hypothetical protein